MNDFKQVTKQKIEKYVEREKFLFQNYSNFDYTNKNNDYLNVKMHNDCRISIIVPMYNEQNVISTFLQKLYNNNINSKRYEVLIINNNSDDNSIEIIYSFLKHNNIQNLFIINEYKQGLVFSNKKGFDEVIRRYHNRDLYFDHYIINLDSDTFVNNNWIKKYENKIKNKLDVIISESNWDIEQFNDKPLIKKFLKLKMFIDDFFSEIYESKISTNDCCFNINFILDNIITTRYYRIKDSEDYIPAVSNDWNLAVKLLENKNYKFDYIFGESEFNLRKVKNSIKDILNCTLYDKTNLHTKIDNNCDITKTEFLLLLRNSVRGSIAYNFLLHCYYDITLLDSNKSIKFLGKNLTNKLKYDILITKEFFGKSTYDEMINIYNPAMFLYMKNYSLITYKIIDINKDLTHDFMTINKYYEEKYKIHKNLGNEFIFNSLYYDMIMNVDNDLIYTFSDF